MKKTVEIVLIFALLISVIAATRFVDLAASNPYPAPADPFPIISVLSPENNTKTHLNNVNLTFTLDLSAWDDYPFTLLPVEYYLDGNKTGEIDGNTSDNLYSVNLTGLPEGLHSVEVKATTTGIHYNITGYFQGLAVLGPEGDGPVVGSSGPIYFTIDFAATEVPDHDQNPFSAIAVAAAAVASVIIVGVGLLVYFGKNKKNQAPHVSKGS